MTNNYLTARRWADKFQMKQRRQLANLLNVPLDAVQITDEQTDIAGVDVTVGQLRIGLRVRRANALTFGIQPTLRLSHGRNGRNELQKIITGEVDLLLLNFATDAASISTTDDDDGIQATVLLDLGPVRRAAGDGFRGVQTHDVSGDRSRAVAIDLASLVAVHGPCLVAVDVPTTVETVTTTTDPFTGRSTTTRTLTTTPHRNVHPELLADARRRAVAT